MTLYKSHHVAKILFVLIRLQIQDNMILNEWKLDCVQSVWAYIHYFKIIRDNQQLSSSKQMMK